MNFIFLKSLNYTNNGSYIMTFYETPKICLNLSLVVRQKLKLIFLMAKERFYVGKYANIANALCIIVINN